MKYEVEVRGLNGKSILIEVSDTVKTVSGDMAAIECALNLIKDVPDNANIVEVTFENCETYDARVFKGTIEEVESTLKIMASAYEMVEEIQEVEVEKANATNEPIEEKNLEVGKVYVAYKYHLHRLLHTFKAQIIGRTKKTVTVEVWKDGVEKKTTFKNRRILLGGSGDVLDEVEYFTVYDEGLCYGANLFFKANRFEVSAGNQEAEVEDYAVIVEAQEVAVQAEIDNATMAYELKESAVELFKAASAKTEDYYKSTAYGMVSELIAYKIHDDEVTAKLVAEGKLTDADLANLEDKPVVATINFNFNDTRVAVARGMVSDAELNGYWYQIQDYADLHFFNVNLLGLKKLAKYFESTLPYTYHVMAVNAKGNLTFDGKRISKLDAEEVIYNAICGAYETNTRNSYANTREILYTDKNVSKRSKWHLETSATLRIVDFGRDEVPYINNKVTKIIDGYKQKAREEDREKAAEIAYKASLEYELDKTNRYLDNLKREVFFVEGYIEQSQSRILDYIGYIAAHENDIQEYGLRIDELKAAIEKEEAEKKAIVDKIYMRDVPKNINAIAADIEDDGSNDDSDEDEVNIDFTFDNDSNEDDALEDENLIIEFDSEKFSRELMQAVIKEYAPVEVIQFDLQAFNSVNIADCPATIDTAVSGTFNEINHDAEIEEALKTIKNLKKAVKANQRDISHYENEIYKAELIIRESQQKIEHAKKNIDNLNGYIAEFEGKIRKLRPTEYWNLTAEKLTAEFNKIPYEDSGEELMKVVSTGGQVYSLPSNFGDLDMRLLNGKMLIMLSGKVLASYITIEQLETAMTGLMTAIKRGDSEYTFPKFEDEEFDNEFDAEFDKELKKLSEKALELDDKRTRFKGKARDKVADKLDEVIETLDEKSEIVDEWFKKQFTFNGKSITLKYCNRELELNEEVFNEEISASCTVYGQIGIFHEKENTMHAIQFYDTLKDFKTEVNKISAAIKRGDSEYIIEGK